MKRLGSHPGFMGYLIVNADGIPIRSSLDHAEAVQYAGLLSMLCQKSRSAVRELDPSNDVTFLRLRSHKHEILVAPDKDYILMVIQAPQVKAPIVKEVKKD